MKKIQTFESTNHFRSVINDFMNQHANVAVMEYAVINRASFPAVAVLDYESGVRVLNIRYLNSKDVKQAANLLVSL